MTTCVVNMTREKCDIPIDRRGPFGNPFRIGQDGTRSDVIAKHLALWRNSLTAPDTRTKTIEALCLLKGKRLGCHCKPLACHGDNYVVLIAEFCPDHRVLVCGGREYTNHERVYSVLSHYHRESGGFAHLMHGAARGADSLAGEWAEWAGVPQTPFPVTPFDWKRIGRSAGRIRNVRMLREGKPTVVIAFPGNNGTAHMRDIAYRAGVPVLEIP